MTLETRPYGQKGDMVSVIGLGGAGLYQSSFADGVATVHRALELGVTYFDTSPEYGGGMSQAVLRGGLEGRSEKYLVATKLGRLGSRARYRSYDALRAQLDENLRLLGRQSVDALQIHHVDMPAWWTDTPPEEERAPVDPGYDIAGSPVVQVLRDAREEGLCRYIGPTQNHYQAVASVLPRADFDVCLPANNYDVLRRGTRREVFPIAKARNVTVVIGGILLGGRLTYADPGWINPGLDWFTPEIRNALERLYTISRESGLTPVELTIRYLLADRDFATLLVGAAVPSEIEVCVAAAEKGPLPADLHRTLEGMSIL